jgi:uridine kinase
MGDDSGGDPAAAPYDDRGAARTASNSPWAAAAQAVTSAIADWRATRADVLIVAMDGHGTAGKSTLAAEVARVTAAALVHTDDFFLQQPAPSGHRPSGPRSLRQYYDWRRIRAEALEPLRAGRNATFRCFDWSRGTGLGGVATVRPSGLILLEGVFSAAPELSDLVDWSVFVDTPERERLRRLQAQVAPDDWDADWLAVQQSYFDRTRPVASFDLVVSGANPGPAGPAGGTA